MLRFRVALRSQQGLQQIHLRRYGSSREGVRARVQRVCMCVRGEDVVGVLRYRGVLACLASVIPQIQYFEADSAPYGGCSFTKNEMGYFVCLTLPWLYRVLS